MTTLNQIMKVFKEIGEDHYQINTTFLGDTFDFQAQTNIYPALIVITQPSNIQIGRILYKFSLYVADILNKDRSNVYEIESDMFQICNDIINELKDKEDVYNFWLDASDVLLTPFEESLDDVIAGWEMQVTIECINTGSTCEGAFKTKNSQF